MNLFCNAESKIVQKFFAEFSAHPPFEKYFDLKIKIPVQVPAIETCFMSIDELLVARILSKSRSPYIRAELNMKEIWRNFPKSQVLREAWNFSKSQSLGGSSEFFQVPGIWRSMKKIWRRNMKDIWRNMKKYEGITKDIWGNMKEIWRNMWEIWIMILPIYGPWDFEKTRSTSKSQSSYRGG